MKSLMCFDFDQTIMELNTDTHVRDILPDVPDEEFRKKHKVWTDYMREVFLYLHSNGKTPADIFEALDNMEFAPGMKAFVDELHKDGTEMIILSDANSVFIERILTTHKMNNYFGGVFTNPARFDEEGLLHIERFGDNQTCSLCNKNMCKGQIMDEYISKRKNEGVEFDIVGYCGDGSNDFCPMLRLKTEDVAFPRIGEKFQILRRIERMTPEGYEIRAEMQPWEHANDIRKKWTEKTNRLS